MAIRLALLAHHYRSDWEWTDAELARAQARLDRWRAAVAADRPRPATPSGADVLETVRARMADDLDAPGALAADRRAGPTRRWPARRGPDGAAEDAALIRDTADALLGVAL